MNRRMFLASGSALATVGLPVGLRVAEAQTTPQPMSQAVIQTWLQSIWSLYVGIATAKATGNMFQAVATASQTLFANMQETGWNQMIQSQIANNIEAAINGDVNNIATQISQNLANQGVNIPASQIVQAFNTINSAQIQSLAQEFAKNGLGVVESSVVAFFTNEAANVGAQTVGWRGGIDKPHIQLVYDCDAAASAASACGVVSLLAGFGGAVPVSVFFGISGYLIDVSARAAGC